MRKASVILGLCGGAAGIIVHLALLGRLLVHGGSSSGELARLVIAVILGIAAVAASLATRRSLQAAATFLMSIGILGLFPRPLTWIPAACLLLAAGGAAFFVLRRPAPDALKAPAPIILTASDGVPLHWSEAARFSQRVHAAAPTYVTAPTQVPVQPIEPPPEAVLDPGDEEPAWTIRGKGLVFAAVVAAAAVVIPLSLLSPDSVAEASEPARLASAQESGTAAWPEGGLPEAGLAGGASDSGSTTTSLAPAAALPPFDPDEANWYSDLQYSLTMAVPIGWVEVHHSTMAGHDDPSYHVAAFAQLSGPTLEDAYLNAIDVDIMFDARIDQDAFLLLEQAMRQRVTKGPDDYDYFHLLEPLHEIQIGEVVGLSATARITWKGRVMVKRTYGCVANHCLYLFSFQTDDAAWDTYEPLFDDVVDTISFGPQGSRI